MAQYKSKINSVGVYQPFYGYTCISFLGAETLDAAKKIENFIKTSSLKNCFSALPYETFHMTLFNIYCMAGDPIPPVVRWMQNESESIPEKLWLQEDVLKIQHIQASNSISKLSKHLKVKNIELYSKKGLGVWVELQDDHKVETEILRRELSQIYEHDDKNLRFHITFAYKFQNCEKCDTFKRDLKKLKTMVGVLVGATLENHNIYLYNSMTNYIPQEFFYT